MGLSCLPCLIPQMWDMESTLNDASCPGVSSHANRVHGDRQLSDGVHQNHTCTEGGQQTLDTVSSDLSRRVGMNGCGYQG